MSKKLILHIGSPKTGTSSIQNFCVANAEQLASQGIAYPIFSQRWPHVGRWRNGHGLYANAMRKAGYNTHYPSIEVEESYMADLAAAVQEASIMLLSDETLWQMICRRKRALPTLKQLTDALGFTEYQIVVYLRRQDLYAESFWNQRVKQGIDYTKSFKQLLESNYSKCVLNYERGIRRIEECFGKESLTIRIYDRVQLKNGDSAQDMMSVLGIEDLSTFKPLEQESNDSIKGKSFLMLKHTATQSAHYVEANDDFLRPIAIRLSHAVPDENPGPIMNPEHRAAFLADFAEGNRRIAQEYFGRDELFGPQKVDGQEAWTPAPGELTRDSFLMLLEQLVEERADSKKTREYIDSLEDKISALEERVKYLERVNRNSLGLKVERALRGSKMKR